MLGVCHTGGGQEGDVDSQGYRILGIPPLQGTAGTTTQACRQSRVTVYQKHDGVCVCVD